MAEHLWPVLGLGFLALLANLPLGAWRVRTRKFTAKWFVAVHLSIPLIFTLRILNGISPWFIPVFIFFAICGQLAGGRLFPPK
jgi:hypothetical protein